MASGSREESPSSNARDPSFDELLRPPFSCRRPIKANQKKKQKRTYMIRYDTRVPTTTNRGGAFFWRAEYGAVCAVIVGGMDDPKRERRRRGVGGDCEHERPRKRSSDRRRHKTRRDRRANIRWRSYQKTTPLPRNPYDTISAFSQNPHTPRGHSLAEAQHLTVTTPSPAAAGTPLTAATNHTLPSALSRRDDPQPIRPPGMDSDGGHLSHAPVPATVLDGPVPAPPRAAGERPRGHAEPRSEQVICLYFFHRYRSSSSSSPCSFSCSSSSFPLYPPSSSSFPSLPRLYPVTTTTAIRGVI